MGGPRSHGASPSGETARSANTRGVGNDALAIYFLEATIASALVARWRAAERVGIVDWCIEVRDDERRGSVRLYIRRLLFALSAAALRPCGPNVSARLRLAMCRRCFARSLSRRPASNASAAPCL